MGSKAAERAQAEARQRRRKGPGLRTHRPRRHHLEAGRGTQAAESPAGQRKTGPREEGLRKLGEPPDAEAFGALRDAV